MVMIAMDMVIRLIMVIFRNHVDEPQGNIRSLNPYYFAIIFACEFSTQAHPAIITNVNPRQRILELYKSTTQRDILDRG